MEPDAPPDPSCWSVFEEAAPFIAYIGPPWRWSGALEPGEPVRFGFRVAAHHCNLQGTCHGGMLASFADFAMFWGLLAALPELRGSPSVNLSIDFFAGAQLGEWVETRLALSASTRRTVFMSCELIAGTRKLIRATGIYPAWRLDGDRG